MECRYDFSTLIDVLRLSYYTRYNVISMIDDDVVGLGVGVGVAVGVHSKNGAVFVCWEIRRVELL